MGEKEALGKLRAGVDIDRAFAVLVELYADLLLCHLRRKCRNYADAEELTQQTFIVAFKKIKDYDPERGPFLKWLGGIGDRLWLTMCRGRYHEAASVRTLAICGPVSAPGPDEELVRRAREDEVWEMLRRLDLSDSLPAVLHWMEGKTHAQTGLELGIPERTAKAHALRTMHLLRLQAMVKRLPRRDAA